MQLQHKTYGGRAVGVSTSIFIEVACVRGPEIRANKEGGALCCSLTVCCESSVLSVTNSILSLCPSNDNS